LDSLKTFPSADGSNWTASPDIPAAFVTGTKWEVDNRRLPPQWAAQQD